MRKNSKKYSIFVIIGGIFFVIGVCIRFYAYRHIPVLLLKKEIEKIKVKKSKKRIIFYFIENINIDCQGNIFYPFIHNNDEQVYIFVTKDYTDIEINNMKQVFNIRNYPIRKIINNWEQIYLGLKKKYDNRNFIIIYENKRIKIRSF